MRSLLLEESGFEFAAHVLGARSSHSEVLEVLAGLEGSQVNLGGLKYP
jgi:hypothetical protein